MPDLTKHVEFTKDSTTLPEVDYFRIWSLVPVLQSWTVVRRPSHTNKSFGCRKSGVFFRAEMEPIWTKGLAISIRKPLITSTTSVSRLVHPFTWTSMNNNEVHMKRDETFSTFSMMPRSPSAITRLTIVPAFWAIEYAEATNRINTVGLDAMMGPEGKSREMFCYFQNQLLVSFTWIQFNT